MSYYFYSPFENKIVVTRYAEFFEKNLITQEVSFLTTSKRSDSDSVCPERDHSISNHLCLNVEAEEHSLGDLNEPTSYKVAMLDSESNKRIDSIDAEIQSMIDNMVWALVDLPPNCKIIGSKWIFKKKTDMDGIIPPIKLVL
ncbi:hypothetical protein Tco_1058567 [Tanacetum coccineum]|uniref:Reverse transcriptase Ty1/copia-type domain-containing protein n=1 Tax=Tanacetum coccineum TaxID=301880 RepID=A0ABQ5HA40_9ASTR